MVITLPGERPLSWNQLYAGRHWKYRQEVADKAHRVMQQALAQVAHLTKFEGPVVIEVVCYMKSPLYDADNVCTKMYIDGLKRYLVKKTGTSFYKDEQKYWIIEDDNPLYVTAVGSGVIKDKDNPRVEIHIKPYEQTTL